ncbi:hypothetical protein BD779DRAFT_1784405 [Infundibulicybe gibba]|nr:hypothetical protein BD779DRAFT_1784405 [Infundibulicybe gibba]
MAEHLSAQTFSAGKSHLDRPSRVPQIFNAGRLAPRIIPHYPAISRNFNTMPDVDGPYASLDLTHVLYDDSSLFSLGMALVTLSPILLMAAYAALAVQTREFIVIVMWMGQFLCEGFNWALKHALKQDRPFVLYGYAIGVFLGVLLYTVSELLPARRPTSIFGQTRTFLVGNPLSTWLRIRDGWAVWDDGGREAEWIRWKDTWERKQMKLKAGH